MWSQEIIIFSVRCKQSVDLVNFISLLLNINANI